MAVTSVVIPQAQNASAATLYSSAATTTSGSAGPFPCDFFSSAEITVACSTCSGTLDVYVQKLLPDGVTYDDVAHFAQWTTSASTVTRTLSFVNGGNTLNTNANLALTAGSVLTVHFGAYWRVAWVIAGASATSTFGVYGDFRA